MTSLSLKVDLSSGSANCLTCNSAIGCFSTSSAISSMRRDTEELLKEMELVTAFAICFITDEISTDNGGKLLFHRYYAVYIGDYCIYCMLYIVLSAA